MSEIIFEVTTDDADGGFVAKALGHSIVTQAETIEELRQMARDAVRCRFESNKSRPKMIRLHFVQEEVFAA